MRVTALILFLIISQAVNAQFKYIFTSIPDSSEVLMNGEKQCYTPCAVNLYWFQAKDKKITFEVKSPGFKTWSIDITEKPNNLIFRNSMELNRELPVLEIDSTSPIIAFDRIMASFKDGKVVGKIKSLDGSEEELKWEGSIKIGEAAFEDSFYNIITNAGLNSVLSENAKLFSSDTRKSNRLPRYLIGARIIDYNVNVTESDLKNYNQGNNVCVTTIDFEWQVLDKANNKVVLNYKNTGKTRFRYNYYFSSPNNLNAYEDALIDFLKSSSFLKLLKNTNEATIFSQFTESKSSDSTLIYLPIVQNPSFETLGSMINYVNQSCVTVLTDGGHGSGFIINKEGLMLTSLHVVNGVNRIQVQFPNGQKQDAKLIRKNEDNDLALLDINGSGFQAIPLLLNNTSLGDDAITIGTPADPELGQSISKGIISGKRKIEGNVFIQADIAVSPGNSGGPLLNNRGEVVGIVQSKLIGKGIEGIGFAIPIENVLESLNITIIK